MIDTKDLIGRHKYNALKGFDFKNMTTEECIRFRTQFKISVADAERKVNDYEKYKNIKSNTAANANYFKNLDKIAVVKEMKITKRSLWEAFLRNFKKIGGIDFVKNNDTIENIKPIFHYFLDDLESFKNCKRVSNLSAPSFDRGLLIVGDFGNGKTTTMKVFEKCLRNTHKYFKGYGVNDVVLDFEGCKTPGEKTQFIKRFSKGILYFDDVKSERTSSNYNKMEVFREILENRYNNNSKTFITCNYKKGKEGDLKAALDEFGEKYGDRVNDRIYKMFNILEFKGKSFRGK